MRKKSSTAKPAEAKDLPQISDAELVIMKVIWTNTPTTANKVVEALEGKTEWKPKTIQTLLARLVQKGALAADKGGREYVFRPLVSSDDYVHAATRSFLRRFFDGDVAPFLARFLEREKLSRREIEELKEILKGKRE
jgi:BlaI family transcriptional regulator, penicillinase repressor